MAAKNLIPLSTVDVHGADKHDDTVPSMSELEEISKDVQNNATSIEENFATIEEHTTQVNNLDGDLSALETRVSSLESDVSNINRQLDNVDEDLHQKMHGSEQHNSDYLHDVAVGLPKIDTKADARQRLEEGMMAYIKSKNAVFYEDGT